MTVTVSTFLNAKPDKVWDTVKKKELLFYVIQPLAKFTLSGEKQRGYWQPGKHYRGKSYVFSFIPIGERKLVLESIDNSNYKIQSREKGEIGLKKWDHLITVKAEGGGTLYIDSIEIDAGLLTPFYWLFAFFFYRHRQRKWRKLVGCNFSLLESFDSQ